MSRNAVLVRTIRDIITRMARMGLNTLMLYTEDVYMLEGHPYFNICAALIQRSKNDKVCGYFR